MEVDESGARQSRLNSSIENRPDFYNHRNRDVPEKLHPEQSAMATAALISPSTPYHPHHSHSPFSAAPYPARHSHSSHTPAMISPVDSSRRTSDDSEPTTLRQSLPSIQDIIGGKPAGPPITQSLPSPFSGPTSAPPVRAFADGPSLHEGRHSPRPFHPSPTSFPRSEPLPAFSDPSRTSGSRPGPPPLSIFSGPHHSPPVKPELHESADHRHAHLESAHVNGHGPYSHHPPHPHQPPVPQAHSPYSHAPVPLPPGQLPLSAYPISPRHSGPPLSSPYDGPRPPLGPEEEYRNRLKYDANGRHYEPPVWSYADQLSRIGSTARTVLHFAETYDKIAQEENGPPLPGRLPSEAEISDMMNNCEYLKGMFEQVRNAVKQTLMHERVREGSRTRSYPDDEDINMYGADAAKQSYGIAEVKKRRGTQRAAPPGRCHSCNRIDTPEWRRGPDGARTLCNACGLHYAKLERKRQTEQRSIRPKPSEDR